MAEYHHNHNIKKENVTLQPQENKRDRDFFSLSCSSSEDGYVSGFSSDEDDDEPEVQSNTNTKKKKKKQRVHAPLPLGFLDPIRVPPIRTVSNSTNNNVVVVVDGNGVVRNIDLNASVGHDREQMNVTKDLVAYEKDTEKDKGKEVSVVTQSCRQFWKAGDYEGCCDNGVSVVDMDHVRVHPKFLHSNATSHKWALGAFAELLDNALDEVCYGATYVHVDVLDNTKDNSKMLLVQDNGGGMNPDKMRQCMSLGYSVKSKMANTIGQYGNGFKTSTMRLGADVLVFSRSQEKYGASTTQSVGMLSYTFLRNTGKEDIVVPMIDFERKGETWTKLVKSSAELWQRNIETIVEWSPYESEQHLLQQFDYLDGQGTRVIIYNLWYDDEGKRELDFDADEHDIQLRVAIRDDQKNNDTVQKYPSCSHYFTYQYSLRSYASILYRKIPPGFRIILRGKDVDHHDIIDDMIHAQKITYKPVTNGAPNVAQKDMVAEGMLGFFNAGKEHIDIQGFNVYHKNRLIKPFWRVWNAAGSDGRLVIGVLEANFIEPAHDKQGFERTTALSRLENKLIKLQKAYWSSNCQLIGYAQRRKPKKTTDLPDDGPSPSAKDNSNSKYNSNVNTATSSAAPTPKSNANIDEYRSPQAEPQAKNHVNGHRSFSRSEPQVRNHNNEYTLPQSHAQVRSQNNPLPRSNEYTFPQSNEYTLPQSHAQVRSQNNPPPAAVYARPISAWPSDQTTRNLQFKRQNNNLGSTSVPFQSYKTMAKEIATLKEENNMLRKRQIAEENARLKEENNTLRKRLSHFQNELESEKKRSKTQLDDMKQRMDKMEQEHEKFVNETFEERS